MQKKESGREPKMSMETMEWLNTKTLIGDTDRRGTAWHYRAGATNHYPGAVPIDVVEKLICPFEPLRQPLYIKREDGSFMELPNFIGMAAENARDDVYAVHSGGYEVHPFRRWLIEKVSNLVDEGNLHVSSAGVLAKGAVAWVEISIADTLTVEGFDYRPHLLATTSANGRYETTYGRKAQATVCDNTLAIADREQGSRISYRHTKGSVARIKDVAEATGLILSQAAAFDEEVRNLLSWQVKPALFSRFLDEMIPEKGKDGMLLTGAALTRVEKKRETMAGMWNGDPRVSPWNGTALGILQLSNTWQHHNTGITKATAHRVERNMLNAISGKTEDTDMVALGILNGLSQAYGFTVPEMFSSLPVPELATL
jgi:phage/plasmid-like protein (TIGR03299 family)